jgi:hypothetical protein
MLVRPVRIHGETQKKRQSSHLTWKSEEMLDSAMRILIGIGHRRRDKVYRVEFFFPFVTPSNPRTSSSLFEKSLCLSQRVHSDGHETAINRAQKLLAKCILTTNEMIARLLYQANWTVTKTGNPTWTGSGPIVQWSPMPLHRLTNKSTDCTMQSSVWASWHCLEYIAFAIILIVRRAH